MEKEIILSLAAGGILTVTFMAVGARIKRANDEINAGLDEELKAKRKADAEKFGFDRTPAGR
ncbi:MAG: hypothetical protein LBI17_03900 [Rickettsiales bacterium]|jgi:hypothetical protein|nr:hypothetical protein [Rickettsiales bacterium]